MKIQKNNPAYSFVFTARNDNYGGNLINRINTALKVLMYLAKKYQLFIEIVIVEYNPPHDTISLKKALTLHKNKYAVVRFIQFPAHLHRQLQNSQRIKLFEYSAKNIGIRRSKGDYIISTNQDIIFSEEFLSYLKKGLLHKNIFYRINRYDVTARTVDQRLSAAKILSLCKEKTYLIKTQTGDRYTTMISVKTWAKILFNMLYILKKNLLREPDIIKNDLHMYAAGDFLMMHRNAWFSIKGYDETTEGNDFLDGYILFLALIRGLKQTILPFPLYHIDHEMSKRGRPSIGYLKFLENCNRMIKTKKPYKVNSDNWGKSSLKLKETTI